MNKSKDKILQEIDVYIGNSQDLFLLQFPLKRLDSEFEKTLNTGNFKPKHKRLELKSNYPSSKGLDLNDLKESDQIISSHIISQKTNLAVG